MEWVVYLLIGSVAGIFSGLLGIGGGLIVVPALDAAFTYFNMSQSVVVHLAVANSLAAMVFTTQSAVLVHYRHGNILWKVYQFLAPGLIVGAILGANVADDMPGDVLRIVFGILMLFIASYMFWAKQPKPEHNLPGKLGLLSYGSFVGFFAGLLGVGSGTLVLPFLIRGNVTMKKAVGLASVCSFTIAVIGAVSCIGTGLDATDLPEWSTGYVYWPAMLSVAASSMLSARLGIWASHRLPVPVLKKIFAVLLLFVGLRMLWR